MTYHNKTHLLLPTNETNEGPIINYANTVVSLKYDQLRDNGLSSWTEIKFNDVLAYEVINASCCDSKHLLPSGELHECESEWLSQIIGRWSISLGWQEYQKQLGGSTRFKHYQIYFDDVCSFQIVAASYSIHDLTKK